MTARSARNPGAPSPGVGLFDLLELEIDADALELADLSQ